MNKTNTPDPLEGLTEEELSRPLVDSFTEIEREEAESARKPENVQISNKLNARMGDDQILLSAVIQKVESIQDQGRIYSEGQNRIKAVVLKRMEQLSAEISRFYNQRSAQLKAARAEFNSGIGEIFTLETRITALEDLAEKQANLIELQSGRIEALQKEIEALAAQESTTEAKKSLFGGARK